jgi:hypothetical protein
MKKRQTVFSLLALLAFPWVATALLSGIAQAQDADEPYSQPAVVSSPVGRKMLYLFSTDFPPNTVAQYPTPPAKETRFWQLLDREIGRTSDLSLTENALEADYRVELRCGGVFNCSKLLVDVKSPDRIVLTSFKLKNFASFLGLGAPRLEQVARELSRTLDQRIQLLEQGGYGHTD